jgi:DNA-binding CsgD family transcriptional regulator
MIPSPTASGAALTDAQCRYLRLVAEGKTSKQIAQAVGGSHHTINVQIGIAMRILGATSRQQAAAMLDAAPLTPSYEPSYETPAIAEPAPAGGRPLQQTGFDGDQRWTIPVATMARPINTMAAGRRLVWILAIAASVTLLLAGLVSGVLSLLSSLGRLI